MMIGPEKRRKKDGAAKGGKKQAKAKAQAERDRLAARPAEPRAPAVPEPPVLEPPVREPAVHVPAVAPRKAPRSASRSAVPLAPPAVGTSPGPEVPPASPVVEAPDAPGAPVERPEPAVAPLVERIDRLRGRVDDLLALVDPPEGGMGAAIPTEAGGSAAPGAPAAPAGLAAAATPPVSVGDQVTAADAVAGPSDGDAGAGETATPSAPASASALLVARELLGRGIDPDTVRRSLRDGYGVADPDTVLAAL